jgi:hypothetical protein
MPSEGKEMAGGGFVRANISDIDERSSVQGLDLSVVGVAFVDQLCELGERGRLNQNGVSSNKPLNSFAAGRGSERSLVVVDMGWGFYMDGEGLSQVLLSIEIPAIKGILCH